MKPVRQVAAVLAIGCLLGFVIDRLYAEDEGEPKHTIKEVMQKAHKSKLINRLAEGQGTKEEAQELLDLYRSLGASKPPMGELEGWKKKTAQLIAAAEAVVAAEEGAGQRLTKAANCAGCHKEHKPAS